MSTLLQSIHPDVLKSHLPTNFISALGLHICILLPAYTCPPIDPAYSLSGTVIITRRLKCTVFVLDCESYCEIQQTRVGVDYLFCVKQSIPTTLRQDPMLNSSQIPSGSELDQAAKAFWVDASTILSFLPKSISDNWTNEYCFRHAMSQGGCWRLHCTRRLLVYTFRSHLLAHLP